MAAKVASSGSVQQGSSEREEGPAGVSYASVLNPTKAAPDTSTSSSAAMGKCIDCQLIIITPLKDAWTAHTSYRFLSFFFLENQ